MRPFVNLSNLLSRAARLWPDAPAVALGERTLHTYRQLAARVEALSSGLRGSMRLAPEDRVAIISSNCPEYLEVLLACWHAGLVAVPINAKLHREELGYIIEDAGASLVFASPELASGITASVRVIEIGSAAYEEAALTTDPFHPPAGVTAETPAWLFFTSGTTGKPKGAVLTHRNLLFMSLAYVADIEPVAPGATLLHAAPMSHGSGLYALPHVAGGGLNVIPESSGFDPNEVLREIGRHTRLSFFAAPTMVTRLMAASRLGDADLRNLGTIIYGGAPMYLADCLQAIECFGPRLFNLFGQGESPMTITGLPQSAHADTDHPRFRERLSSCGVARSGVEVHIFDEQDRSLPPGEVGEIVTRSDCVMRGYWNQPQASAAALRGGWLHTGDLGSFDADGFLTLHDRSKDLIISGGSNIYPREVEEVLLRDPRVAECSVVGRPHPDWGEEVVAFIVPASDASLRAAELDALCLDHIARFKRPKHYRFVESLPKNNYGKVLKTELRRLAGEEIDLE
jgi:long-chain acyl-CoA synthetase